MLRARLVASIAPLALVALTACGGASRPSADAFEGAQKPVAQVILDLAEAAGEGDAATICSRILARELVDAMAAPGRNCTAEVDKTLGDADDLTLSVERVDIAGNRASAVVADGQDRQRTLVLTRESRGWRIAEL